MPSRQCDRGPQIATRASRLGMDVVPGRRCLCLAQLGAHRRGPGFSARRRARGAQPSDLGKVADGDRARPLSLSARALLVRRAEGQDGALGRRSDADFGVADRQEQEFGDRPLYAETN